MSELKPFIEEKCKIGPQEWEQTSVLYDAYETWCEKRRMVPIDYRQFVQRLADYGSSPKSRRVDGHTQPVRGCLGIRLLFDSESKDMSSFEDDEEDAEEQLKLV
jgi:phage/plasmid-associated DNA primase